MRRGRTYIGLSVLLMSAVVAGCGDSIAPVVPATATAALSTAATDGAILLRVTGPGFDTPTAVGQGQVLYWRQVSESEIVVAVFGAISNGVLFKVDIPDGSKVGSYVATVLQVADRGNDLRDNLSGYSVAMTVPATD